MSETLILNAAVAVATVYENKARGSGKPFWNVVTDTKDRFTAFSRELVASLIDGRPSTVIAGRDGGPDSLAYNLNPPLNTMVFFEPRATGKVLVPTPDGMEQVSVIQAVPPAQGSGSASTQTPPATAVVVGTPPRAFATPPYRPNPGYQKSGGSWKPEDKRPGLVTMTMAYSKDVITAIISNSDDLKSQDPEAVIKWAEGQTVFLAESFLNYTLSELKTLGFKLEPEK